MTEPTDPKITRHGIHIDPDIAKAERVEEELDANVVGPYRFPDPRRRRTSAVVLAVATVALATGTVWVGRLWLGAAVTAGLALWFWFSAWPLSIDQDRALEMAVSEIDFAVGHASAAITFHGFRSRPRWAVILYPSTEPPDRRALVSIDAVDGTVVGETYVEDI